MASGRAATSGCRGSFGGFGEFGQWLSLAGTLPASRCWRADGADAHRRARAGGARRPRGGAEPLRAALIGFAAEIFFIPFLIAASIALAITIIGIPFVALFVPMAMVIAAFALVLGYTALACRIGEWLEDRLGGSPATRSCRPRMGFFLIVGPTLAVRLISLAPDRRSATARSRWWLAVTIEFLVWTIGLGAAIMTGLGRWYTAPPPIIVHQASRAASPSVAF